VHFKRSLYSILLAALLPLPTLSGAVTEIPFRYERGLVWVKVSVAGQPEPLNFLLDTGAGATILNLETARRLQLSFGNTETVQGVSGCCAANWVDGFHASFADVALRKYLLAVDLSALSRISQRKIDGLIGADFFQHRIVQIDYAAGKIRLLDKSVSVATDSQILPLEKRNGTFSIPVTIAGVESQWMRLDSGCDDALLWTVSKNRASESLAKVSVGISSGSSERPVKADVMLGTEQVNDVKVRIHDGAIFPGESGLVGNGILSRFKVTIDSDRRKVALERQTP
jgi:hypothetical protein